MLSEPGPQLVWTSAGAGIWSGPQLVLVAAWLPRVTGVRSTVLPSHFWAEPKIWTISGLDLPAVLDLDLDLDWWLLSDWLLKKVLLIQAKLRVC